jgi:thiosulfate/3-mercaptopyruvate sulfurtransferase
MSKKVALTICTFLAIMAVTGFNCSDDAVINNGGDHQYHIGVVNTEWLESNLNMKDLVIIDVRSAEAFSSGHIENSINIPFNVVSDWTVMKGDLLLEVPEISQLAVSLGQNGISRNNKVVLVGGLPSEQDPFALAAPTRVALTLAYAGVQNLAILDGCFNKWQDEGRSITTATTAKTAVSFEAAANNNLFVDINYLKSKQGTAIVVDARDANVYSGEVIEMFADKAGHIPGAVSLPAPSLWNEKNGTYKTRDQIATLASSVLGQDKNKEIILYCGVGGYASSVWFALTQILDYKNVKIYDGAAQEWVIENEMELSPGL